MNRAELEDYRANRKTKQMLCITSDTEDEVGPVI